MSVKSAFFLSAALAAAAAFAEENAAEAPAEGEKEAAPKAAAAPVKPFTTLPLCRLVEGTVEMRLPGAEAWVTAEEGRFCPLGSSFRTSGSGHLVLAFGADSTVSLAGDAEIGTRLQGLGEDVRRVVLRRGTLELALAENLPAGAFSVALPSFVARDLKGDSRFILEPEADGELVKVRCVTGAMAVGGQHFDIREMQAADEMWVRSTSDHLCTFLYGKSGDYIVELDKGIVEKTSVDDNGQPTKIAEKAVLKWPLSPETKVRIDRKAPAIGQRLAVNVFTFDTTGQRKNWFNFTEDLAAINSGELVAKTVEEAEALAKKAAEATTEGKAETAEGAEKKSEEEGGSDDAKDEKKEEKKSEE